MQPVDAPAPHARGRLYGSGLWLLVPAPALVAMLLLLQPAHPVVPWGYLVGPVVALLEGMVLLLAGVLVLAGLVLAAVGTYRTRRFPAVAAGLAVVSGSFLFVEAAPGTALPILCVGVGLVAIPARPVAVVPAVLAGVGLLFLDRSGAWPLTAAALAVLAVLLALAGRGVLEEQADAAASPETASH